MSNPLFLTVIYIFFVFTVLFLHFLKFDFVIVISTVIHPDLTVKFMLASCVPSELEYFNFIS